MNRESIKIILAREALLMSEHNGKTILDGENTLRVIDMIFNDFESKSCTSCKWCKFGGEFANDECHNTSLSGHLEIGTLVSDDFYCNRWEARNE